MAAINAVLACEQSLGRVPQDVSARKCGYDIESRDLKTGKLHFIEVKGRIEGGDVIIVTRNEILTALNAEDKFVLAVVHISANGFAHEPVYIRQPFEREPDFASTAVVYGLNELLPKGMKPH